MKDKGDNDQDDSDLDYIPAPKLRAMIRKLRSQRLSDRDPEQVEKDDASAEEERTKLADLHEEKKGASPKVAVTDDDFPEDMKESCDCDDEDCDDPSCTVHNKKRAPKGR
mgnify:CR=1 FL=1